MMSFGAAGAAFPSARTSSEVKRALVRREYSVICERTCWRNECWDVAAVAVPDDVAVVATELIVCVRMWVGCECVWEG